LPSYTLFFSYFHIITVDFPVFSWKNNSYTVEIHVFGWIFRYGGTRFLGAISRVFWACGRGVERKGGHINRIKLFYGLLSLFALLVGMVIYLLFRDVNSIVLFRWIPKPAFLGTVLVPLQQSAPADQLRYNLPDALWFISAVLFIRCIWFYKAKTQAAYITCFYGIALALETSQLSEKVPGTFDWKDLLFFSISAFIEGLSYKFFTARRLA